MATPVPRRRHHAWMLWCIAPIGFGAWVPLAAGLRARRPLWIVLGIVICAVTVAGWILSSVIPDDEDGSLAGMLIVTGWVAATAATVAIYPSYRRRQAVIESFANEEMVEEGMRLRRDAEIERRAPSPTCASCSTSIPTRARGWSAWRSRSTPDQ
jgi:hypothetical protein